jgi:NitT/TauT family transport system permease protein
MSALLRHPGAVQRVGMVLALLAAALLARGAEGTQPSPVVLANLAVVAVLAFALDRVARPGHPRWQPALALVLIGSSLFIAGMGLATDPAIAATRAYWAAVIAVWLGAWMFVARLAELRPRAIAARRVLGLLAPLVFGLTALWLWQVVVSAGNVPRVILPAPSVIAARIATSGGTLWTDFVQTFVKGALTGFAIGVTAALVFAVLVDRSPFLKRGLLPVGSFVAALPIIGTAPIMVMWFGFDWPSKAAVVVAMVFFPMLVNSVQGLASAGAMQRDLMHTWSASYWQSLVKLRLPAAMPFIFNGLKICSTLALIGAIVAEFFGSPTRGMGFRISTEVGRLQLDMVWAEITVAAVAGSAFYGVWAALERRVTFWHPSQRGR